MNFSAVDLQKDIYIAGMGGQKPLLPVDLNELEKLAKARMSAEAYAYVAGGAGIGTSIVNNREGFKQYRVVPRMLRDVSERDTSIELFGQRLPAPLLASPVGVLDLAHKEADLAVARALKELGVPMIFSNQASVAMEDCAAELGDSPRWFQLYWSKSNDLVASFLQRAEKCGCTAIVVTLDTTMLGWRIQDLDQAYLPFLRGKGIAQYTSDPVFQRLLDEPDPTMAVTPKRQLTWELIRSVIALKANYPGGFWENLRSDRPLKAVRKFVSIYSRPSIRWEELPFLREHTSLPIILKGILHPDDARKAVDAGMDGIICSNHGGRQVDGAISTIEALPGIVEAVNGQIPVLMDSGVRCGADVLKALALGAKAVCIGRPYVYGLALAGQAGVEAVFKHLMADFELNMGLAGCTSVEECQQLGVLKPLD